MNVSIEAFDTTIQRSSCRLQDCRMSKPCPLRNIVVFSFSDNVLLLCSLRSKFLGTFTGAFPSEGRYREIEFFGTSVHAGLRWAACQAMRQSRVQNRCGDPPPCILGRNGFPHWSQHDLTCSTIDRPSSCRNFSFVLRFRTPHRTCQGYNGLLLVSGLPSSSEKTRETAGFSISPRHRHKFWKEIFAHLAGALRGELAR